MKYLIYNPLTFISDMNTWQASCIVHAVYDNKTIVHLVYRNNIMSISPVYNNIYKQQTKDVRL